LGFDPVVMAVLAPRRTEFGLGSTRSTADSKPPTTLDALVRSLASQYGLHGLNHHGVEEGRATNIDRGGRIRPFDRKEKLDAKQFFVFLAELAKRLTRIVTAEFTPPDDIP
jgi:hypothetical protein